jgi:hypothetical protein
MLNKRLSRISSLLLGLTAVVATLHAHGASLEKPLATLVEGHPRLILSDAELAALKSGMDSDPDLQRMWAQVHEQATAYISAPPLKHELKGPRLLGVSRECLARVYPLALAWRWTGDAAFAEAAIANLKTVCDFPDWNPSHFLDVAEMTHAVAIGYDWLYAYMDETTREAIRAGLIKHGLEAGVAAYAKAPWWAKSEYNWNQVCNSGLLIGALAVAETDPAYATAFVPKAVSSLPIALESYNPEGVWSEGPAYWHYATRYTAYGLAALQSALGSDFGLGDVPGLRETAWFPLLTTGPTGLYLNFADSGQNSMRKPMPTLFWLARTYDLPAVAALEHALLESQPANAIHLAWYIPRPKGERAAPPLDRAFKGNTPVAITRSAWNDLNALFAGVKGGYNQVNHGQLDLGNFEFDALGNRWARDLGSDDYNLPGYFDRKPGGKRWLYYRNISQSHNVPLINGQGQDPAAKAEITRTGATDDGAFAIVDLSDAYEEHASAVTRGVASIAKRKALLVQDEFTLRTPAPITWGMTTDADITINAEQSATLVQNGKRLHVTILSPESGSFSTESAEQAEPQHPNKGVERLLANVPAGETDITVSILLRPEWPGEDEISIPVVRGLSDW